MIVGRFAPSLKSRPAAIKRDKPAPLSIFHKATLTARRKRMKVTLPRPCERSAALDEVTTPFDDQEDTSRFDSHPDGDVDSRPVTGLDRG
jgi:hypothetical protein